MLQHEILLRVFDVVFVVVLYFLYKTFRSLDLQYDDKREATTMPCGDPCDLCCSSCTSSTVSNSTYESTQAAEHCPVCLGQDFRDGGCRQCCCRACETGFHHYCLKRQARSTNSTPCGPNMAACPCCPAVIHERNPNMRFTARLPGAIANFMEGMASL